MLTTKSIFMLIMVATVAASCTFFKPSVAMIEHHNLSSNLSLLKRTWYLVDIEGFSRQQLVAEKAALDLTNLANASGYMGCNQLGFAIDAAENGYISFKSISSTRMYCGEEMKLEQKFSVLLPDIRTYRIRGHYLILESQTGQQMKFVVQDWD